MGSRPRRVAIADDHQDAADTMAILLRLAGYDAQVAYGGAEVVQIARTFKPEVLDINIPRFDGYDVASALRREGRPDRRPLPIALTYGNLACVVGLCSRTQKFVLADKACRSATR